LAIFAKIEKALINCKKGTSAMNRQQHTAEEIINKLREAEVLQAKGMSIEEVMRQLGVSDATYYGWRKEYGGLRVDKAKRL
jgi:transposase-like protein